MDQLRRRAVDRTRSAMVQMAVSGAVVALYIASDQVPGPTPLDTPGAIMDISGMKHAKCFVVLGGIWQRVSVTAGRLCEARGLEVHWV